MELSPLCFRKGPHIQVCLILILIIIQYRFLGFIFPNDLVCLMGAFKKIGFDDHALFSELDRDVKILSLFLYSEILRKSEKVKVFSATFIVRSKNLAQKEIERFKNGQLD